ncbi:twin-arginine translocation signal domain-containing protein, partial [Sphingobium sp.]|uniref:twin-arginine translocation signal domain-containing protein n=1 Tax=Sphingobium sp. TaxID=1912891 RepID=UPI002BA0FE75
MSGTPRLDDQKATAPANRGTASRRHFLRGSAALALMAAAGPTLAAALSSAPLFEVDTPMAPPE